MIRVLNKIKYITKVIIVSFFLIILMQNEVNGVETIIRVAIEPKLPPYQFEENGKYLGLHIDILEKIAEEYNFIIEYIPMNNSDESHEALRLGKVDVILGDIYNNNTSNDGEEATDIISQSSIFMITLDKDIKNLKNKIEYGKLNAVLQDETISYSYIREMSAIRYTIVSNQIRAFELLKSNRADVLIGVKESILYQLRKSNIEDDYIIVRNYMVPIEYAMVVKKGNSELLNKLNRGIQEIRLNGDYEKFYEKWIYEVDYQLYGTIRRIVIIILIILLIITIVFIVIIRINKLLKSQVEQKTAELKKINIDLENQIIETRNSSELNNRIVENSPSGIIVFDREFNITLFNKSAWDLTKVSQMPKNIFDIKLFENILQDKLNKIFEDNYKFINREITFENKEREKISYRYNIYHLYDFDGSIRGAILTIEDVTKELRIKEQAHEKEKNIALNQIIAGLAHEIRNPLTSIRTFMELIPLKKGNQQFQDQLAEYVPKEVDRVNNLINNLLDYAKPCPNNKERILVDEIIQSCTVLIKPIIEHENINLNISVENNLMIKGDKNQIKQSLINILLNGLDAMQRKNEEKETKSPLNMGIKAWATEHYINIEIYDEGIGMTQDEIKKSVEPFFTTKSEGTGLGLALTKQFVEENEGILIIESELWEYTKITLKFRRNNG